MRPHCGGTQMMVVHSKFATPRSLGHHLPCNIDWINRFSTKYGLLKQLDAHYHEQIYPLLCQNFLTPAEQE